MLRTSLCCRCVHVLERVLDVSVVAQAELSFFCGWTAEEERGRATEAGPGSGDENAMQMRSA
jgi:hypothetical protein